MKKNRIIVLFSLMGLLLPSCGKIDDFFNTIREIVIKDYRNAYYMESSFMDKNQVEMFAKYTDGSIKPLSLYDVSIYMYNEKGVEENAFENLKSSGTYCLYVKKGAIYSNTIFFDVDSNMIYVNDIDVFVSHTSTRTMDQETFTLNITPSNYNVDLEIEFSNEKNTVMYRDGETYNFYFEEEGEQTLTVKAPRSPSTYASKVTNFTVSDASGKTQLTQNYKVMSTKNCPTIGDVNFLVVPIWLTDSSSYIDYSRRENVREDLHSAFFGTSEEVGWESVATYYSKESGEKLNIGGTVAPWYTSSYTISDIGNSSRGKDVTPRVVEDAVNYYFSTNLGDSRSNYDSDGDGYLDGVVAIYGAPDYYSHGVSDYYREYSNLWAYCAWNSSSASTSSPNLKDYLWASYDFMYGYSNSLERTGHRHYKGNTVYCKLDTHTYLHESGHLFGLEDYYDYQKVYSPVGGFTMQDSNVGGHDPFSVLAMGWANPMIPTESCRIKLHTFQESKEVILLTPHFNSYGSPFDEYVLVELYAASGLNNFDTVHQYRPENEGNYPIGAENVGIRVWHVDARLTRNTATGYDTNLFTDASYYNPVHAFSNTSYNSGDRYNEHASPLWKKDPRYCEFDLLHLIRNRGYVDYKYNPTFSNEDMFYTGDNFNMDVYGTQFARKAVYKDTEKNVLDSSLELGWSFTIEDIKDNYAIINLVRA